MSTTPEPDCISRIEGAYEHLATKADLERAKRQIILAVGGIVALITLIERWPG